MIHVNPHKAPMLTGPMHGTMSEVDSMDKIILTRSPEVPPQHIGDVSLVEPLKVETTTYVLRQVLVYVPDCVPDCEVLDLLMVPPKFTIGQFVYYSTTDLRKERGMIMSVDHGGYTIWLTDSNTLAHGIPESAIRDDTPPVESHQSENKPDWQYGESL